MGIRVGIVFAQRVSLGILKRMSIERFTALLHKVGTEQQVTRESKRMVRKSTHRSHSELRINFSPLELRPMRIDLRHVNNMRAFSNY